MKNIVGTSCLFLLLQIIFTSCTKEDIDPRTVFVSTYTVTETWKENGSTITKPPFIMTIVISTQSDDVILLNNFANYGAGVTAEASTSWDNFTIIKQTLQNSKEIIGSGRLIDPNLTFTYTETYNNVSTEVTVTAKKK